MRNHMVRNHKVILEAFVDGIYKILFTGNLEFLQKLTLQEQRINKKEERSLRNASSQQQDFNKQIWKIEYFRENHDRKKLSSKFLLHKRPYA